MTIDDLAEKVKALAEKLGKTPSKSEFQAHNPDVSKYCLDRVFTYTQIVEHAGLIPLYKQPKKYIPARDPIFETPSKEEVEIVLQEDNFARILVFDIETAPILAWVWKLFDENIGLNQIEQDWFVMCFAAKWIDRDEVFYFDQRNAPDIEDDKQVLAEIWKLLDQADIVITQNGKKFDKKKLYARFIQNGFKPPTSFRHIDTLQIAKKHFAFTSNKLEYLTNTLNVKFKKLDHAKFSGFKLWKECLKGNVDAWNEMEEYCKHDVTSLEELYKHLRPWDNTINFSVYSDNDANYCLCGSDDFKEQGFKYTNSGKFVRYVCSNCGAEYFDKNNQLDKEKRKNMLKI